MKLKIFAALLIGMAVRAVLADDQASLTVDGILKASHWKYETLDSYSDTGKAVSTSGTNVVANYNFTIRLSRPDLYQVVWRQGDDVFKPAGVVWSTGKGDFFWMAQRPKAEKCQDRERAIASATGISGGAAASVPATFFKMNWGNALNGASGSERKADAKVGDTDCFVLGNAEDGRTNTLWIGKQDLLIHQIEHDTSGESIKAMMTQQIKEHPQLKAMLETAMEQTTQGIKSVETHENIVLDAPIKAEEFDFQPPVVKKD